MLVVLCTLNPKRQVGQLVSCSSQDCKHELQERNSELSRCFRYSSNDSLLTYEIGESTAACVPFPFSPSKWHNYLNFVRDLRPLPVDTFSPCDSAPINSFGASSLCAGSHVSNSGAASQSLSLPLTGICCSK